MIWIHFNHSIDVIFILKVVRVVNHVPLVNLCIRAINGTPQPYVLGLEQCQKYSKVSGKFVNEFRYIVTQLEFMIYSSPS